MDNIGLNTRALELALSTHRSQQKVRVHSTLDIKHSELYMVAEQTWQRSRLLN